MPTDRNDRDNRIWVFLSNEWHKGVLTDTLGQHANVYISGLGFIREVMQNSCYPRRGDESLAEFLARKDQTDKEALSTTHYDRTRTLRQALKDVGCNLRAIDSITIALDRVAEVNPNWDVYVSTRELHRTLRRFFQESGVLPRIPIPETKEEISDLFNPNTP